MIDSRTEREARDPMKPLEYSVLLVLAEREEYGYGIVKRIAEASAGGIRLAPSNLYYVLERMAGEGLVEEAGVRDAPSAGVPRRYYRITSGGRAALAAETQRLAAVVRRAERLGLAEGEA